MKNKTSAKAELDSSEYDKGFESFFENRKNPHPKGSAKYKDWLNGFADGEIYKSENV